MYKDYKPTPPRVHGHHANPPTGVAVPAPSAPSVGYSARPGRMNKAQYEAQVRKQQQALAQQAQNHYSQYPHPNAVHGAAGVQRKQSHHRIW